MFFKKLKKIIDTLLGRIPIPDSGVIYFHSDIILPNICDYETIIKVQGEEYKFKDKKIIFEKNIYLNDKISKNLTELTGGRTFFIEEVLPFGEIREIRNKGE